MAVTLKTSDPITSITSSLVELAPNMQQMQESLQTLVSKTTDALAASEENNRKLQAELIQEKAAHAADKVAYEQQFKDQQALNNTMQKTMVAMQERLNALEDQTKYIRPTIKAMVSYGDFLELDYPGKKEDLAARKPILQAAIASNKQQPKILGAAGPSRNAKLHQELQSLEAEAARLARFEAREGKV